MGEQKQTEKTPHHNRLLVTSRADLSASPSSAQLLSRYRPRAAVIAVTRSAQAARQVHLCRGVFPLLYREPPEAVWADDVDRRVQFGIESGKPPSSSFLPGLALARSSTQPPTPTQRGLPPNSGPRFFPLGRVSDSKRGGGHSKRRGKGERGQGHLPDVTLLSAAAPSAG